MNPHTLSVSTTGPGHSLTDRRISVTFACVIMSRLNSMLALFQNQSDDPNSVVLNSSPRAPPLCIFRMLLLSLQMFVLLERKCPAKWTSQDIPP